MHNRRVTFCSSTVFLFCNFLPAVLNHSIFGIIKRFFSCILKIYPLFRININKSISLCYTKDNYEIDLGGSY
ncbi:MAG: hypothetical protein ACJAZY_000093 [Spirosomataceae bacterium]|jgi:hypothetical protein